MTQEVLLYDVVHDYIISENFASNTEGANKVMLKLSDELMQEIYERTMTASEKRKDTMLKKKYDDSDMKKNMQGQYGKEEGKKVYFATIRKQAMKKEEVEQEDPSVKAKMKRQAMIKKQVLMKKLQAVRAGAGADITSSHELEGEVVEEVGISSTVMMDKAKKEAMLRKKERDAVAKKMKKVSEATTDYGSQTARDNDDNKAAVAARKRIYDRASEKDKNMMDARTISQQRNKVRGDRMKADQNKPEVDSVGSLIQKKLKVGKFKKMNEDVKRDEYGDPVGGPKISKKQLKKNLAANAPDEDHTNTTAEGYGSDRVGPALKVARAIDKVNPRPKPNSKRTAMSRALKMASIKKDEKIRKRKENPYSTDKKLKMVATSIRDRVKQKVKSMATSEDFIPEEGYDVARDQEKVKPSKDKKDATTMPPSKEMMKTQKVNKGHSALELVRKKYGKSVMGTKK
tara:strand:- start:1676 stop:3046 length:1371 start_codon:yes stop_codon:yes gene_type:complete